MDPDLRYRDGDPALGLAGGGALLHCPADGPACNKGFTPHDLAGLYAAIYQGEIIGPGSLSLWLGWMEKSRAESALLAGLPPGVPVRAFVKDGFARVGGSFTQNYLHEAGIIETPQGAFVLAVFTQGNPEWPGEAPLGVIPGMVYQAFAATHSVPQP